MKKNNYSSSRRKLIKMALGAGVLSAIPLPLLLLAAPIKTKGHIVIIGDGAAGLAMANRLRYRFTGNKITLIGARMHHYYQPGYTMIASGLWKKESVISQTADWLPQGIDWIAKNAKFVSGATKTVTLADGQSIKYDALVVATGCQLNFHQIEGLEYNQLGTQGIGSVYVSPQIALQTSQQIDFWLAKRKGRGIFTLPDTSLKCAGAPLKMTFTTLSRIERLSHSDHLEVDFFTPYKDRIFSVPLYNRFVTERWQQQGVHVHYQNVLKGIDAFAKKAYFRKPDGALKSEHYDFIHIVPPMSAPDAILQSDLVWQEGPYAKDWLEVDPFTLQHRRFPEVFGIGDVAGIPLGKTAASVKLQAPVVEANLISYLTGRTMTARYNGYTSCPLITAIGKAILAEFGYGNVLLPSFSFIDPTKESWAVWVMEEQMLHPAYNAMLLGKV
ncbi:MAG: hypothetical protein CENE_02443 [Candidatus Celerinatantimonas neptuna]|nr:MAG: hypothetical protein CENE_02443 [Candidatus Celerinatantimonas neptuna]